jgi:hypothetical protein
VVSDYILNPFAEIIPIHSDVVSKGILRHFPQSDAEFTQVPHHAAIVAPEHFVCRNI